MPIPLIEQISLLRAHAARPLDELPSYTHALLGDAARALEAARIRMCELEGALGKIHKLIMDVDK